MADRRGYMRFFDDDDLFASDIQMIMNQSIVVVADQGSLPDPTTAAYMHAVTLDTGWGWRSDGSDWSLYYVPRLGYSNEKRETSVGNGTTDEVDVAASPDASYYTVSAGICTAHVSGWWNFHVQATITPAGNFPLLVAIQTPGRNSWDSSGSSNGREYGTWARDWNGYSRSQAHWSGYIAAGETFSFLRSNMDGADHAMQCAYTINFEGV